MAGSPTPSCTQEHDTLLIAEHQKTHYTDKFSFVGKLNQESYVIIYGRLQQLC